MLALTIGGRESNQTRTESASFPSSLGWEDLLGGGCGVGLGVKDAGLSK